MDLKDLMRLQKEFDDSHESSFPWNAPVSQHNLGPLEYSAIALAGEVGEIANIVKKIVRGDSTLQDSCKAIMEESADVFAYLMKLCNQMNIDLERAYLDKRETNQDRFSEYEIRKRK